MKYTNIENLTAWIEKNLKMPCGSYDLDVVLDDIWNQYCASGSTCYELGSHETVSGNPECYSYDVEVFHNEDTDVYESTFIF